MKSIESGTFLTFRLGNEVYGLGIVRVREIVECEALTIVPRTPAFMRGVMNLRGSVVPVVDMNLKLGLPETDISLDTCVIIVEVPTGEAEETMVLGVMVDGVEEVLELKESDLLAAPRSGTALRPEFLAGMGRREGTFIMILEVDAILAPEELAHGALPPPASEAPSSSP